MTTLAIIAGIFIVPLAALLLGALASLGWCLVRDRIAGEMRGLKRDLDNALQREWQANERTNDLRRQLDAVARAERRTAVLFETWN